MSQDVSGEWMPQAEALRELKISRSQFWRLRRCGLIKPGHLYRSGDGPKARLFVNPQAVRLALMVHTASMESPGPA